MCGKKHRSLYYNVFILFLRPLKSKLPLQSGAAFEVHVRSRWQYLITVKLPWRLSQTSPHFLPLHKTSGRGVFDDREGAENVVWKYTEKIAMRQVKYFLVLFYTK